MTDIVLFGVYLALGIWFLSKWKWLHRDSPGSRFIIFLFFIKVAVGLCYSHLHLIRYGGGDAYSYFRLSQLIYAYLPEEPLSYLYLTFHPSGVDYGLACKLWWTIESLDYWENPDLYLMVRIHSVLNLLSGGRLTIHYLFLSFAGTICNILMYRGFVQFGYKDSLMLILLCFFVPSTLFWSSGFHKDSLGWMAMGVFIFASSQYNVRPIRNTILFIASLYLLFIARDFLFYIGLLVMIAYLISSRVKILRQVLLLGILITGFLISASLHHDSLNIISRLLRRQYLFHTLSDGKSEISTPDFYIDIFSFLGALPQALYQSLLSPFYLPIASGFYLINTLENLLLLIFILLGLYTGWKEKRFRSLTSFSFFIYSLIILMIIGIVVPNVGSIVRYRSLILPLMLIPLWVSKRKHASEIE